MEAPLAPMASIGYIQNTKAKCLLVVPYCKWQTWGPVLLHLFKKNYNLEISIFFFFGLIEINSQPSIKSLKKIYSILGLSCQQQIF